jgi:hypothetical protein
MGISFNNKLISKLEVDFYRNGCWVADCLFANDPVEGTKSQLIVDKISWVGTVVNSTVIGPGQYKVRIVAGNGEMTGITSAENLTDTNGRNVINKLIGSTETIGNVLTTVSAYKLKQWEILNNVPRGLQLSRLIERFSNHVWRFSNAGALIITDDSATGNTTLPTNAVLKDSQFNGSKVYSVSTLDKMTEPGSTTADGWKIEQVNLSADHKTVKLTLFKTSLTKLLDELTSRQHRDSMQRCYPARVEAQNSDGFGETGKVGGSLKLLPDDPRIRGKGMDKVPIRGIPGALYRIPAGARCFIQFDVDDPSKPFVSGFETTDFSVFTDAGPNEYTVTFGHASNADFVALSTIVNANFQTIKDYLTNAIVLATPVGPTTPGDPAASTALQLADVAAIRLKTE